MHLRSSILDPRSAAVRHRYPLSFILCPLPRPSFTIVELMISIALVVILMVGIHQVFKMSSDTVGIGNTVGAMAQSNRSVQQVFRDDYQRLAKNAPLFILRSGVSNGGGNWGAFTTDAERSADRDGDPLTQDLNGNGIEDEPTVNGERTPLSIYNSRNHRVDIVGFPANGLFHRHTANDGSYSSPVTAQDAFIFYQHMSVPTYTGGTPPVVYFDPGDPDPANRNNYLASQWILGRVALLMRDPPMPPNGTGAPEMFVQHNNPSAGVPDLSPLHNQSMSPDNRLLRESRYDLLGASLETLRQDVSDVRNAMGTRYPDDVRSTWWQTVVYRVPLPGTEGPPGNSLAAGPLARFQCNPRVNKPITSEAMAKAMPVLLNNCSQFIVEYAGDYLTQDNRQFIPDPARPTVLIRNYNWGRIEGIGSDGVIDFVVDHTGVISGNYNVAGRVRWYGLPRDTNGDRIIRGFSTNPSWGRDFYDEGGTRYNGSVNGNELIDVVPLWDVIQSFNATLPSAAFEREAPLPSPSGDYSASMLNANPATKAAFRYTCVWANSAPAMLRIVLKLEDPAGRLPEGQWYEYVVGAP